MLISLVLRVPDMNACPAQSTFEMHSMVVVRQCNSSVLVHVSYRHLGGYSGKAPGLKLHFIRWKSKDKLPLDGREKLCHDRCKPW